MKEKIGKKGIKKRLFSVVLALAMVFSLMPMSSLTVYAISDNPFQVYKQLKGNEIPAVENQDYEWSSGMLWLLCDGLIVSGGSSDNLVTEGGISIGYSSGNVAVSSVTFKNLYVDSCFELQRINDNDNLTLTLKGTNQIGTTEQYSAYGFHLRDGFNNLTVTGDGALTIYDQYDGIMSEGSANVTFDDDFTGTLTINDKGDTVPEPEPEPPCAISIGSGTLTVNNGTLNLISEQKNGITAGTININGGTVIAQGGTQAMSVAPTLGLGVKVEKASKNFDGSSPEETYDSSDINSNKYLKIAKIHTWTYSVNGATLTATCNRDCGASTAHTATLTLTATSTNYSGSEVTKDTLFGNIDFSTFNAATALNLSKNDIKIYAKADTSKTTELTNITANGWYVAELTVDTNKTARLEFPVGNTVTVTFDANGHGTAPAEIKVLKDQTFTAPTAPTASGYTFGGWYKEKECTTAWNFATDGVTQNTTLYAKWTQNNNGGYRPSGGGSNTPPATNATISGETGSTTNVSVNTSGGQATVSDIPKNTVESIANSNVNGSDIVLDVSKAGNSQVTKVTLTKNTVENISKALDSNDNNKTNLVVKTGNAEVTFDAAAVKAIADQAKAGNIQIVVENTTTATLNDSQKKVVEDLGKGNDKKEVVQTFEASIVSGGVKISDFKGGNVTVAQVKFSVPAGKKASNYHIYYIPTSGAAERCNTWVKDGRIYFVTGHFSDYVIVYDETVTNGEGIPVYRLYHHGIGDHLFTTSAAERDMAQKIGYKLEGVGFYASGTGKKVYRLYNKNSGEHFYTASEKERDLCKHWGWRLEGVAFTTEGEKKVYRLYNGRVHFYTSSEKEKDFCLAHGWRLEGIGFNAN